MSLDKYYAGDHQRECLLYTTDEHYPGDLGREAVDLQQQLEISAISRSSMLFSALNR